MGGGQIDGSDDGLDHDGRQLLQHCGSDGNKEGKSKTQFHKEISILIKQKKPLSQRNEKDVENKIGKLERQFREASDWANNAGQGVDDPGSFHNALLKRCPFWDELNPIMGDGPNANALATNEELSDDDSLAALLRDNDPPPKTVTAQIAVNQSLGESESVLTANTTAKTTVETSKTPKGKGTTEKKRRLAADKKDTKKQRSDSGDDDLLTSHFGGGANYQQFREREVAARETEANARMLVATEEAGIKAIQKKAALFRERKRLQEEGALSKEDIDLYFPLPKEGH